MFAPVFAFCLLFLGRCCGQGRPELSAGRPGIQVGAEVLVSSQYEALVGLKRVGIIANPTSILPKSMEHIVDRMHRDAKAGRFPSNLTAVFGPEHGFRGDHQAGAGGKKETKDRQTNLTVYNTYGVETKDLVPLIQGVDLDAIIFDIQDVGSRYYTFIWTMFDMMCAAAAVKDGFHFYVLDRPNPLGGITVRGPMLEEAYVSGVGKVAGIPVVHGMTVGELANYFNDRAMGHCDTAPAMGIVPRVNLTVVRMVGWDSSNIFPGDKLPWVLPSPNMPTVQTALVYPGLCLLEGSSLSEGRGTTRPFQMIGAPYLSYTFSLDLMQMVQIPAEMCGVLVREAFFIPTFSKFTGKINAGVDLTVTDPACFDPLRLVLEIFSLAKRHGGANFSWVNGNDIDILSGSNYTRIAIDEKRPVSEILSHYNSVLRASGFLDHRKQFLLYPR